MKQIYIKRKHLKKIKGRPLKCKNCMIITVSRLSENLYERKFLRQVSKRQNETISNYIDN